MSIKPFIKVPLVLLENIVFAIFPGLRPWVERNIFNPYDFNDKHIKYSKNKFAEFKKYTEEYCTLNGKTVLELGPGGSIGFGLLVLQNGATKYVAVENGAHTFIEPKQLLHYKKILNDSSNLSQYFVEENGKQTYNPEIIQFVSISQDSRYPLPDASVDIIYSCAVLEHVHDLNLCFSEMTRVLKLGGIMYHEVDLRDHIFSQQSLWFLTISDFWFRLLFGNTGELVNRERMSFYINKLRKHGIEVLTLNPSIRFSKHLPQVVKERYSDDDARTLSFISVLRKTHG